MSDYRDEYGNPVRTDEYGNPIRADPYSGPVRTDPYGGPVRTDEYGNPIPEKYDTGYGSGAPTGGAATGAVQSHPEKLHRSGSSSSSSSSEDDGQGGRRKKGLKEKIKEKLPGVGHKPQAEGAHYGETTVGQHQHHEKKGMMEKIKEKLPGGHHDP